MTADDPPNGAAAVLRAVAVAATAALLSGCMAAGGAPAPAASVDEVKVGLLAPLAGTASAGRDAERGAQLAAQLVNEDVPSVGLPLAAGRGLPGLGGAKLTVQSADTGGDADKAMAQATKLIGDNGVRALVAADTATVTAAVIRRTERQRMLAVDGTTSAGFLTELGLDWYFRAAPTDKELAAAAFALLRAQSLKGMAVRRLAIVAASDQQAATGTRALRELADGVGYQVVVSVEFVPGGKEPTAQAKQVRAATPDAVLVVADAPEDAAAAVRAVQAKGAPLPIIGLGRGFSDAGFAAAAGTAGNRLFRVTAWSAELAVRQPVARSVADLYQQRYGSPMTEAAAGAFTATLTLAAALDRAGGTDADKIRTAMLGTRLPGSRTIMPWDGVQFGPDGQNALAAGTVEQLAEDKFRVVFPRELSAAQVEWPGGTS